jgi:hypothetical protein
MKEKLKGGVRKGAGRKPSPDPKQPVTMFVETSIIEALGGKEGVRGFLYGCLEPPDPEKKFPPSDLEIKQKPKKSEKRPIVTDLTKPTGVLKLQEQPKSNFTVDTTSGANKAEILAQIAELEKEMKSPPKNPIVGVAIWKRVREEQLQNLKDQLNEL